MYDKEFKELVKIAVEKLKDELYHECRCGAGAFESGKLPCAVR